MDGDRDPAGTAPPQARDPFAPAPVTRPLTRRDLRRHEAGVLPAAPTRPAGAGPQPPAAATGVTTPSAPAADTSAPAAPSARSAPAVSPAPAAQSAPAPPAAPPGGATAVGGRRPRRRVPVAAGLVAVGMLAAAGAAGQAWVEEQAPAAAATCAGEPVTPVVVAADPTIAPALAQAAAEAEPRPLEVGGCVDVVVEAEDPLQTSAELSTLPVEALPDLWVPDSSTWLDRIAPREQGDDVGVSSLGSLASSPLVVAVEPRTAAELGWSSTRPTWRDVLTSGRPVALPDLAGSAAGLSALAALRDSVRAAQGEAGTAGDGEVRAVLTSVAGAIERGRVPTVGEGLALAEAGGPGAPLVPTSEQQWFLRTRDQPSPRTVGIRPRDGSILLDYPLVAVDRSRAGQRADAVEGVIRVLEGDGRREARSLGFDAPLPDGGDLAAPPAGGVPVPSVPAAVPAAPGALTPAPATPGATPAPAAGPPDDVGPVLPPPSAAEVDVLLADLDELSRPARVLLVIDTSVSMRAMAGGGTRATLARDAVKSSLALFADSASVGLWFFAVDMGPRGDDWTEVVPVRRMTDDAGGVSQRAALLAGADTLTERLTPGGTGLHDTVLAAFRAAQAGYDPAATNSLVVVTDGQQDQDPNGVPLDELTATLAAEADPERPVRVSIIGLAADTDPASLRAIAEAAGGLPYLAERPEDFQTVLFDALRSRRQVTPAPAG